MTLSAPERAWNKSELQLQRELARSRRGRRSQALAAVSTLLVFGLLIYIVVSSPGWERVQETFFNWEDAKESFPSIARGFLVNIKLFLVCEVFILILGLLVALMRSTTSPVTYPFRVISVLYVDIFRGIPTLLLVYLVGFGLPATNLQGVPTDAFWLGVIALTMSYTAYVAEVIRSGIESIHPSQRAAARSLGLSHGQTMRTVVLPQAIRRVAPPLLNDFISLQKDTALVAALGLVPAEALREANVYAALNFNYTSLVVAAAFFIAATIPLARLTDHVGSRLLERQHSAGLV